ncbi:PREDICTED: uncharacterized protein LOC106819855, partial [Priapulus caudatus]|uniref:Uncharacterized protein LOC106819855 n=1 Tax=Priapulus caudatus TaxID=37621 RepID=A0ABM1F643_PRICU
MHPEKNNRSAFATSKHVRCHIGSSHAGGSKPHVTSSGGGSYEDARGDPVRLGGQNFSNSAHVPAETQGRNTSRSFWKGLNKLKKQENTTATFNSNPGARAGVQEMGRLAMGKPIAGQAPKTEASKPPMPRANTEPNLDDLITR